MTKWAAIARRIRVPVGFAFAALYLWLAKPSVTSICAGAIVIITGLAIRALASGHVRKNEQLTTSGPYAYIRHPLYLGSLIMASGFALAARTRLTSLTSVQGSFSWKLYSQHREYNALVGSVALLVALAVKLLRNSN